MALSALHEAARAYAAAGWPVFPIIPNAKEPLSESGFYDATVDLITIDAWWQANPNANIGFWPGKCSLCVVDIDTAKGGVYEYSPDDRRTNTPSGGVHIYYAGSIRQTQGAIAEGVDTRGETGYVLLPPSHVIYPDGTEGSYSWVGQWEPEPWNYPMVPADVVEKCRPKASARERLNAGFEEDKPEAIRQANFYLDMPKIIPMQPDDPRQDDYAVAAKLIDFGISPETGAMLCIQRGGDPDHVETVFSHMHYRQNEEGCDAPTSNMEAFQGALESGLEGSRGEPGGMGRTGDVREDGQTPMDNPFALRDPTEWWDKPEIEFYDEDGMLPKIPGGSTGILFGEAGHHKTNTLLTMMYQVALDHGLKVCYVAGEGLYGFCKNRTQAHAKTRGVDREWVREHLAVVCSVPVLTNLDDVKAFIAGVEGSREGWIPDIVIIDTLATATPGVDENAKIMSDILSGNGAAGVLRVRWGCMVIGVSHVGKDPKRGIRGHSGQHGNIDFEILTEAHSNGRGIRLTNVKQRDGEKGAQSFYSIERTGVPVPVKITEGEYRDLTRAEDDNDGLPHNARLARVVLRSLKAEAWESGMHRLDMIESMMEYQYGMRPELGAPGSNEWFEKIKDLKSEISKAVSSKKKWATDLFESRLPLGVDEAAPREERWFIT